MICSFKVFYDATTVRQVDVPSFSGSFGILPRHVPTLAVLRTGVVTVYEADGKANKIFVSSGTVTINDDSSVQILAEEAHSLDKLDGGACRDILNKALSELSSASSELVCKNKLKFCLMLIYFVLFQAKAEAQIAVEVAEQLVQATA